MRHSLDREAPGRIFFLVLLPRENPDSVRPLFEAVAGVGVARRSSLGRLNTFLKESAEQWGLPTRAATWIFWMPFAGAVLVAAARVHQGLYTRLLQEDGRDLPVMVRNPLGGFLSR